MIGAGRYKDYPEDVCEEFDWDWFRYVGDRELISFIISNDPDTISDNGYPPEHLFKPKNYLTVENFINTKIVECNRPRLLKLLEILKNNEDIYINVSW